jgi:GDPmannose 4,6-dehydratase
MENKKALITGINGQDGSYLAEYLLEKGYTVYGTLKRNSVVENQTSRLKHIASDLNLEYADLTDMGSLVRLFKTIQPHEIYNFGAQSHVRISFDQPSYTVNTIVNGTLNLLECIRLLDNKVKFYQASSSEMFGNSIDKDGFQRESTPMNPVSPYGCAKLFGYNIVKNYRHSYNLFLSNGILFNHESPRRGINFVTNKVVNEAVKIKLGISKKLELGNLDASRDWGHAKDYVEAMHLIISHEKPDDFVCSTGKSHTVRELVEYTFNSLDLDYKKYVRVNKKFLRPEELNVLKGDCSKAKEILNWKPSYTFETMLDEMIKHKLNEFKNINSKN